MAFPDPNPASILPSEIQIARKRKPPKERSCASSEKKRKMSDNNEEKTEDAYPVIIIDLSAESRDDIVVSKHFEGCCFCKTVFIFKV